MDNRNFSITIEIEQYLYDIPDLNHFSVKLCAPSSTIVFGDFKTYEEALSFSQKFTFKKPGRKSKKCTVTDFRGGSTSLDKLIENQPEDLTSLIFYQDGKKVS